MIKRESRWLMVLGLGLLLTPAVVWAQATVSPVWVRHAWANEYAFSVRPHGIEISLEHEVYVTGYAEIIGSGVTFDGIPFDESYAFLIKYDDQGQQQWVKPGSIKSSNPIFSPVLSGFLVDVHNDVLYTSEGYIYLFDADMLTMGGVSINAYHLDGTPRWSRPLHHADGIDPGEQPGFILGMGTDHDGHLYAAGIFRDSLLLGPDTLVAFSDNDPAVVGDVFLLSYTDEGTLRWSRRIGGPRHDVIADWQDPDGAFAIDGAGNTYLGGFFSEGATFGEGQPGEVTLSEAAYALFSYDAEGTLRWVRTAADLGVSANAGPWRLAVDAEGHLFVDWFVLSTVGVHTVTVGDTTFTDPGYGGEFLTKVAPDGTLRWVRQLKSDGNENIQALAVDAEGHVYVAGQFDGWYLQLEDTVLRKQDLQLDREDGFVAHYDGEGRLLWAGHAAGPSMQRIVAIVAGPEGDLYVAGEFQETLRLGAETLEGRSAGGVELFVAKYAAASITSKQAETGVPVSALRSQAYPNPFSGSTTIGYEVPEHGRVRLAVYDVLGREVAVLLDGVRAAGVHEARFEAAHHASGLYLYRLEAGGQLRTGHLVLRR